MSLTHIDTQEIEANIEHTHFPVPENEQHASTADYPGLLRAADLIGQLADINYLRKTSALFAEFRETGASEKLGYKTLDDLRAAYPAFSWKAVRPYIGDALRYLSMRTFSQKSTGENLGLTETGHPRAAEAAGCILCRPILGGLHHQYARA